MPASPRDFALWSSMTGNPYPQSDAERAALSPSVYQYVNNIGRKGGVRGFIDTAGKTALAAGAIAGAVALSRTPEGKQIIENVAQAVEPNLQSAKTNISNVLGRGEEGGLYGMVRPGAQAFLGGLKEGAMRQLRPMMPSASVVIEDPEQTVEARRPVTYGKGSTPVDTSRVTWGRGGTSATPSQAPISDPWQERPRGVVVADLSKIQAEGMGGMPYEIQESMQPTAGLEAQLADINYANKAAAYRKSQQYAEMAARYPALQNIGANEELVGGVTGTAEVLPQEGPDVVMDVINRYAPDYQRAKGAQYGREAQGELQRQAAYAGSVESKIDDLLANIRGGPQGHETTTERYNQEVIPAQMRLEQVAQGSPPGAPAKRLLQNAPVTQAEILSTQQTMGPGAPVVTGANNQEISNLDALLLQSHGHYNPAQREALRNELLAKKYGGQPGAALSSQATGPSALTSAPVAIVAANPVAKANRWRQVRSEMDEVERVARLGGYGYDLYQGAGPTAMQEAPGSRQTLLAEQLQRDAMRQAEMQGHYDYIAKQRQAVPSTPYNPQEFRSFMKPASTWMGG